MLMVFTCQCDTKMLKHFSLLNVFDKIPDGSIISFAQELLLLCWP